MTPLTNVHGKPLPGIDTTEPEPGSVLLVQGEHGTAWQRWFKDGLWHSVRGGRGRTWDEMLRQRHVVLVHEATVRSEAVQAPVLEAQS